MKTNIKHLFLLPALIAVLDLITAGRVTAQPAINSEGANPNAGLIISNNTLYGTAAAGGSSGAGTVFAVNTDGTGFRILHTFNGGGDGANPIPGLILSSNTLYGTTEGRGSGGGGTLFSIALPLPRTLAIITTDAAFGLTNGVFGFDVTGPSGSNVVIQASTDLQTWTPLQTNLFGSGPLYFSDPQSTNNVQRFYRAQLSP